MQLAAYRRSKISIRLLFFLWMLLFSWNTVSATPTPNSYDVALRLQRCWNRPVLFDLQIARDFSGDKLPPCEREPLVAWLAARNLEGIWADSVLYIRRIPLKMAPNLPPPVEARWTKIVLDLAIRTPTKDEATQREDFPEEYSYIAVRRNLAPEELKSLGDWIFKNVPMPPTTVQYCATCGLPPETAKAKLEIVLEGVKLSADTPERIVGWIASKDASRVILGHFEQSKFSADWLSPLLDSYRQTLIYRDINGDGVAEIWSLSAYFAGGQEAVKLSIFDLNGKELTREAGDCELGVHAIGQPPDNKPLPAACPIIGYPGIEHSLDPDSGKVELRGQRGFRGDDEEPERIYRFVDGRYIWANRSTYPAELHRMGEEAFRSKRYGYAAWKFEEAARLDPQNAQFRNDAGFAHFKLNEYDVSVTWFKMAIKIDPTRAIAYLNLGDAFGQLNRNAEAREAYKKYLELAPNSKVVPDVKKKLDALPPTP